MNDGMPPPEIRGARVHWFRPGDDASELQRLFERCADFFELIEGAPPGPNAAIEELASIAPGKTAADTFCFGVFLDDRLAAFVNLARDFPKPREWWLAFLILDRAERGRGFGVDVLDAFTRWIAAQSATTLWLSVLSQNEPGHRFWLREGFVERERQPYVGKAGRESVAILMSRPVG